MGSNALTPKGSGSIEAPSHTKSTLSKGVDYVDVNGAVYDEKRRAERTLSPP